MARLLHLLLIGLLCLAGLFMVIAMIPLLVLILLGIAIFSITSGQSPRELTRRTALAASGPRS
ncbi:MAG: hypothetical protein KGJ86_09950 [Chloroflexota bacterium]|nr:hypothetical protein [Chloroflexota bacterium]